MNPLKNPLDGLVPLLGCKGTQFQADGKGNSVLLLFPARHLPPFRLSRSPMRRAKAMAKSHKTRWRRNGKALPSPTHTQHGHGKRKHIHCKRHRPAFPNRTPQRLLKTYHAANCQELPLPNLPFTKILGNARSGKQQSFPFQKLIHRKHSKPHQTANNTPAPPSNLMLRRRPKPRQTASPPPCRSLTSYCGDTQKDIT